MCVQAYLRDRNVTFVSLLHSPTQSAARLAHSVHVAGAQVAKAVLVRSGAGYALAVLPSTCRVDFARLAQSLAVDAVALASEEDLCRVFLDCEAGALPPFGSIYGIPTIVESRLAAHGEIVVGGNTRHEGLRLRYRDYEAVEQPLRGRFGVPIQPRQRRRDVRQAG